MKKMLFTLLGLTFALTAPLQPSFAQDQPVCQYADSDTDGDGYGWENRDSCIVTDQSTESSPMTCIDDDGDGYGWNGREVCLVDAPVCYDSDPVGDGWGWDGISSCEVPAYQAPFSELAVLRTQNRTLYGESIATATLFCAWQGDFQVIDLRENGEATYQNGVDANDSFASWSTGFSDSDGILNVFFTTNGGARVRLTLQMQPESVIIRGNSSYLDSDDCYWSI